MPDVPEIIQGDELRLGQIFLNLTGNALKFTEQGEIRFTVDLQKNPEETSLASIVFEVVDTGIGIPLHKQKDIFEIFTQADDSTTRRYGGSGLGLPIAQSLIGMMGGRLAVNSSPGKGSRFYFSLPYKNSVEELDSGAGSPVLLNTHLIVVVELEVLAQNYSQLFKKWGAQVSVLNQAEELVEVLNHIDPVQKDALIFLVDLRFLTAVVQQLSKVEDIIPKEEIRWIILYDLGQLDFEQIVQNMQLTKFHILSKPVVAADFRVGLERLKLTSSAEEVSLKQNELPNYSGLNVLIVEDVVTNQILAQGILTQLACRFQTVSDGLQALEKVRKGIYFDLILMDIQMPDIDGFVTTRQIRLYEKQAQSRPHFIVGLSAYAFEEDRRAGIEAGMDEYYVKPISRSDYLQLLNKALQRKQPLTEEDRSTVELVHSYYDPEHTLLQLRDSKLIQSALRSLVSDLAEKLPLLEKAITQADLILLKLLLHRFKGSIPLFCNADLKEQLFTAEAQLHATNEVNAEIKVLYSKLRDFYANIQVAVTK